MTKNELGISIKEILVEKAEKIKLAAYAGAVGDIQRLGNEILKLIKLVSPEEKSDEGNDEGIKIWPEI